MRKGDLNRLRKVPFRPAIRKIRAGDLRAMARLYEGFWNEKSSLPAMRSAYRRMRRNRDYLILNAFDGNRLIGTLLAVVCRELYGNCAPFAVIEDFIVDAGYRRKGVGRALMLRAEAELKARGCGSVLLITERNRRDANAFYRALGFPAGKHVGYKKPLTQ